jgi:hypothetical protein
MNEQIRSADLLVKNALSSPEILEALKTKPEETLKKLGAQTVQQLPYVLPPPNESTRNTIWLIVVGSFAFVMIGAAIVLGLGVFSDVKAGATQLTKTDTILTVFMTVVGFLAGLLSPSPIGKTSR